MFNKSPFKQLKKELAELYKKKHLLESEDMNQGHIREELDRVSADIEELIEGRYAEEVFQYYLKSRPILIRIRTGEEISWNDAFGESYDEITKSQKHSLVGLVENTGRYRLK